MSHRGTQARIEHLFIDGVIAARDFCARARESGIVRSPDDSQADTYGGWYE